MPDLVNKALAATPADLLREHDERVRADFRDKPYTYEAGDPDLAALTADARSAEGGEG